MKGRRANLSTGEGYGKVELHLDVQARRYVLCSLPPARHLHWSDRMRPVIAGTGIRRERLLKLLATTQGLVRIASAYVTETDLLGKADNKDVRLLTALSTMDLISGATSLDSLRTLIKTGVECHLLPDHPRLHAKVYIFGDESAVVTSANLTTSALDSNIEVGVQLSGSEVEDLTRWFDGLWCSSEPLDEPRLDTFIKRTATLRKEFAFLRARCRLFDRKGTRPEVTSVSVPPDSGSSLCYFLCNTDRNVSRV